LLGRLYMENKLEVCKKTKQIALKALANTFKMLLSKDRVSEVMFRDSWLRELRKSAKIFPNGWYVPPPCGIITLFATDTDPGRILHPNMRLEETWPRDDIYLDKNHGLIALYASPVDRATGIIGDTELMIYLGNNKEVINGFKSCIRINKEVFEFIKMGQKFCDVAKFANDLMDKRGLENNVISTNDPASVNIGHTIPVTYEDWTKTEKAILKNGDHNWQNVCQMISKRRIFINEQEEFQVRAPMAFTIEPRARVKGRPDLPGTWTHSIALFDNNGRKELFFGYEEIFRICRMGWALD